MSIEVCSNRQSKSDRYRLLLQAGLLVRTINNTIRTPGNSFVLVAIYIDIELCATFYLVYQRAKGNLVVGITNLLIADHVNSFLCRPSITKQRSSTFHYPLRGLSSFAGSTTSPTAFPYPDENTNEIKCHLARLKVIVNEKNYPGFTTKPSKNKGNAPPGGDHRSHLNSPAQ